MQFRYYLWSLSLFQLEIIFLNYLVCQKFSKNFYCLQHFLHSILNNIASTFLLVNWHMYFFVYHVRFFQLKICFSEIFFSALIKGVWFVRINLCENGAIEFKTVAYVSRNLSKLLSCLNRLLFFSFARNFSWKNFFVLKFVPA